MNSGQQPGTVNESQGSSPENEPNPYGPIPPWAWIFAIACASLLVMAPGSVIPSAIGAAGAFSCINIARDETRPINSRLVICSAITATCCFLFLLLMVGVARLQGR